MNKRDAFIDFCIAVITVLFALLSYCLGGFVIKFTWNNIVSQLMTVNNMSLWQGVLLYFVFCLLFVKPNNKRS